MNYQLIGDAMQTLLVNLSPGESVRAEAAAMLFCNQSIRYDARTSVVTGGVTHAVAGASLTSSAIGGQSVAYTSYECVTPDGTIAFSPAHPGKIHALEISGEAWLCQRDCLLCFTEGVAIDIAFAHKAGRGLFGSEGFALLRLMGQGKAWIHLGGNIVESEVRTGQSMTVDAGALACCRSSVTPELQFDAGYRNGWFGGEGSLNAKLTGAGQVMLQTLPLSRLAGRIAAAAGDTDPAPSGAFRQVGNLFRD